MSHGFPFITRKEPQNYRMYVIKSFGFSVKKTHQQEKRLSFQNKNSRTRQDTKKTV